MRFDRLTEPLTGDNQNIRGKRGKPSQGERQPK